MAIINMRSSADKVKGQGVGSCYREQVALVKKGLEGEYDVIVNGHHKSDIYHYHTINPNYYLERMFMKDCSAAVGYVHFLPDTLEGSLKLPAWFKKILYRYILRFYNSMDYLVCVNPVVMKQLREYRVTGPEILYIPNFVSGQNFFADSGDMRSLAREEYGIREDAFVVMGAGQLQLRKGIFDFINTARLLPQIQFVWAGGFSFGKMTDGYEEIGKIVENAPANVKFLGIVEREKMNSIYNMSDLLFLPSYDELFPMVILEALACHKPVLLRDVDIYPDILFDGYLKEKDCAGFANEILRLSNDSKSYALWSKKAAELNSFYSEESVLKMWRMLYNKAYEKSEAKKMDRWAFRPQMLQKKGKLL